MAQLIIEATNSGTLWRNRDFSASPPETNYLVIHDAIMPPDTWAEGSPGSVHIGQEYHSDIVNWEVYRGALEFSLASIPANAIILTAILSLMGLNNISDTDFNITLVSGADLAATLVDADYGDLLNDTTSLGALTTTGLLLEDWNVINLNAAGIAIIKAAISASVVRFGVRSSKDISSTDPKQNGGMWFEDVEFYGYGTANKKPKLTLTYAIGYPSDAVARVSSIRHIFQPSIFRMQVAVGDLGFDIDVAEATIRRELDTAKEVVKAEPEPVAPTAAPAKPTGPIELTQYAKQILATPAGKAAQARAEAIRIGGPAVTQYSIDVLRKNEQFASLLTEIQRLTAAANATGISGYARQVLLKRIIDLKAQLSTLQRNR